MPIIVDWRPLLAFPVASYLIGGIPFGVLIGKTRGVDPRNVGSGNIGATNVLRALGPVAASVVLLLDVLKGLLPVVAARAWMISILSGLGSWGTRDPATDTAAIAGNAITFTPGAIDLPAATAVALVAVVVAVAAMAGHNWSPFLKGKGGKGAATGFGVVTALDWRVGVLIASVFLVVVLLTRYVSLGSTLGSWAVPIGMWALHRDMPEMIPLLIFGLAAAFLVTFKHRANYRRLLDGTESKIGSKPPSAVSGAGN